MVSKRNEPFINLEEEDAIASALLRYRDEEGGAFVHLGDLDITMTSLFHMAANLQVTKFYEGDTFIGIVVFDVGNMWWSDKRFLTEILVLCVDESYHGFARVAIQYLNELAEEFNVDVICAGCYFQAKPQIVTNSYKKDGFTIDAPSYIKVVHK